MYVIVNIFLFLSWRNLNSIMNNHIKSIKWNGQNVSRNVKGKVGKYPLSVSYFRNLNIQLHSRISSLKSQSAGLKFYFVHTYAFTDLLNFINFLEFKLDSLDSRLGLGSLITLFGAGGEGGLTVIKGAISPPIENCLVTLWMVNSIFSPFMMRNIKTLN